jgi:hypothetical protein
VAVAGTLSFTIKMADQEDIVLRRWESRLLRVATWIVELTSNAFFAKQFVGNRQDGIF